MKYYVESGGVNLPDQDKIFNNAGANFRQITQRSKLGLSTISLVFGNATAGGAYVPGMSDFTVLQKKAAKVFLAGPPLVKMATNEVSSDEEFWRSVFCDSGPMVLSGNTLALGSRSDSDFFSNSAAVSPINSDHSSSVRFNPIFHCLAGSIITYIFIL